MGYSVLTTGAILTTSYGKYPLGIFRWNLIVGKMSRPEELNQVVSLLSSPTAIASLLAYYDGIAPFVHDPLLIACYSAYRNVIQYIIQTAPPDVQRFNEALRVSTLCREFINERPDIRANSDGVVVAVDPMEGKGIKGHPTCPLLQSIDSYCFRLRKKTSASQ